MIRDVILPWAMGDVDLGDDVLEVGPGLRRHHRRPVRRRHRAHVGRDRRRAGGDAHRAVRRASPPSRSCSGDATALDQPDGRFTGAACFTMLHHVPTVELQDRLFAEVARVLRPGAALVASDSLASDELAGHHEGDTYNPVDPASLPARLARRRVRRRRGPHQPVRLGRRRPHPAIARRTEATGHQPVATAAVGQLGDDLAAPRPGSSWAPAVHTVPSIAAWMRRL